MWHILLSSLAAIFAVLAFGWSPVVPDAAPGSAVLLAQTVPTPPISTPTAVPEPDLTVTLIGSQNPIASGAVLTYSLVVLNSGGPSGATTLSVAIPTGTELSTVGPSCVQVGGAVTCNVPPLPSGGSSGFTFAVKVTADQGNTISATAIVDPSNLVAESDRTNNLVTITTFVSGTVVSTVTPAPAATNVPVPATPTPVIIVITPTPEPAQAPAPPAPTAPTIEQIWIQVVQPTEAYSPDNTLAWIAQPGEWYAVVQLDAGWALAYWEGDSPDGAVWIQLDERVQ